MTSSSGAASRIAASLLLAFAAMDVITSFSVHHSIASRTTTTRITTAHTTAGNGCNGCKPLFATSASTKYRQITPPIVDQEARDKLLDLYNYQITREFAASQLYLSASIWCDSRELVGMAGYMLSESTEERTHGLSLIDFASKRNIDITLEDIPAPPSNWDTVEDLWRDMLRAEEENTQALLNLADAAQACHDYAVLAFLQPFHIEQLDSESKLKTIIAKVKDENETPGLLRQLDHELAGESST